MTSASSSYFYSKPATHAWGKRVMRWSATASSAASLTKPGARSASGNSTNARSFMRGCGTVSVGADSTSLYVKCCLTENYIFHGKLVNLDHHLTEIMSLLVIV